MLPDPDIARRAFVAVPLGELAPDLVPPGGGMPLRALAARLDRRGLEPLPELTDALRRVVSPTTLRVPWEA